jgi:NADPH2:quinone reductase
VRALQVTRHGDPTEVLRVNEVERPAPAPGEVLVRVGAAALNFNDIERCRGRLVSVTKDPPFTLGMDLCGVVEDAGSDAHEWVGRRVVAIATDALGALAEYAVAPASGVFGAPESLDDVEAAAFLIPFHTTHLALFHRAGLQAGETLLVHSGASGLGTAAVQLGVAAGARVFATVSGPEKGALCTSLGAELVIDHTREDFVEVVLEATGDVGADVVCDLAGGRFVAPSWQCIARDGRYLPIGFTDDDENGMAGRPLRMVSIGNFSVVGVIGAWVDDLDPAMRRFGFNPFPRSDGELVHDALLRLIDAGAVRPHVGRVVTMDEAASALEDHEKRRSIGRTVVDVAGIVGRDRLT